MATTEGVRTTRAPVRVPNHAVIATCLSMLRDKTTTVPLFRRNLQELSMLLLMEASRDWETRTAPIDTPLKTCTGVFARREVALVPILRAGLGMLDGLLQLLPEARVGHIGIYREEEFLRPVTYFSRLPEQLSEMQIVLLDPMLATGNSACAAAAVLKKQGAARIQFLCALSCPAGIEQLQASHPEVEIVTAAIDPELNDFGYIVPGLGDAGDRYFGTG